MYGAMTIQRHAILKARGLDLHVFVRGEDVTHRCRYADDTPGKEVAILFRENARGQKYLDEYGCASVEVADADVQMRPVYSEMVQH